MRGIFYWSVLLRIWSCVTFGHHHTFMLLFHHFRESKKRDSRSQSRDREKSRDQEKEKSKDRKERDGSGKRERESRDHRKGEVGSATCSVINKEVKHVSACIMEFFKMHMRIWKNTREAQRSTTLSGTVLLALLEIKSAIMLLLPGRVQSSVPDPDLVFT